MALLAVTPNPTIDRTLFVPHLAVGKVHRAAEVHCAAGGKGLNVARAARLLDVVVVATGPLGGHPGRQLAELAEQEGLTADWCWRAEGDTRNCILLNHSERDSTVINEPGDPVSPEDWKRFEVQVRRLAGKFGAVTFSGSLPPGVPPPALVRLAAALAETGREVYVDTSGPALRAALERPLGLCIKVNGLELAEALEMNPGETRLEQVVRGLRILSERGARLAAATLGRHGAVAVFENQAWRVEPPTLNVVSTVGSGDVFLAGLAVARLKGDTASESLVLAAACGSANVLTALPARLDRADVDRLRQRIRLTRI